MELDPSKTFAVMITSANVKTGDNDVSIASYVTTDTGSSQTRLTYETTTHDARDFRSSTNAFEYLRGSPDLVSHSGSLSNGESILYVLYLTKAIVFCF